MLLYVEAKKFLAVETPVAGDGKGFYR